MKDIGLKIRILLPLTLALAVLMLGFVMNSCHTERKLVTDDAKEQAKALKVLLSKHLDDDISALDSGIKLILANPSAQYAWKTADKDSLLKLSTKALDKLKKELQVTSFVFYKPNLASFLKVYGDPKYAGNTKSLTLANAKKHERLCSGIEITSDGAICLHVAAPWIIASQVVGYVEVSEGLGHIINKIKTALDVELLIAVEKRFLLDTAMQKEGNGASWKRFKNLVVVRKTMSVIPSELGKLWEEQYRRGIFNCVEINISGKLFSVTSLPFIDVMGTQIGHIVILHDMTKKALVFQRFIFVIFACFIFVGTVLFVSFYTILGRVEAELECSRNKLLRESLKRELLHKKHIEEVEKRQEEIRKKKDELQQEIIVRKKAEEELSKLATVLQHSTDAITIQDCQGNIIAWNFGAERLYRYTYAEAIKMKIFEIVPENKRAEISKFFKKNFNVDNIESFESQRLTRDGRLLDVWLTVTTLVDGAGNPTAVATSARDITKRKYVEKTLKAKQNEIEELNSNLEKRVEEELEKSRQKDLVMIHQSRLAAMGEMIGLIAHQWRQPLNALHLLLFNIKEFYKENRLDEKALDNFISTGVKLTSQMTSTIDDFRAFYRPNKKKELFSINDVIRDSVSLLDASFKYVNISVILSEESQLNAFGFPNEFSQVVLNILGNAKDAILDSGSHGKIKIDISRITSMGVIKISDNGGGIPDDILNVIFEPYFTTKEQGRGTGVGLYMSKMIIERHMDGHIDVKNVDGGAEFQVTVPIQTT